MSDFPDYEYDGQEPQDTDWINEIGDVDIPPEETDLDPIQLGSVEIAPGVFATIYVEPGTVFDPAEVDLSGVESLLGIETEDRHHVDFEPLPDNFDYGNPDVRGPFIDKDSLENFLRETGLEEFGDAFYDYDNDEWFFVVTGTE